MKDVGYRTYTQLYNSMVVAISDYFAGIWGIRKFEQSDKLQNRAIRFFLGLGPKTPICAMQGDMGWTSPSCRHIIKIVKLWNRIIKMEQSRLPFKLLKNLIHNNGGWIKKIKSLSENFNINTNNYTHIPVSVVMDKITQKEQTGWRNTIASKPKLRTSVKFKLVYQTELYVSSLLPKSKRSLLSQFRCGVLPLATETGRYRQIPSNERYCTFCAENAIIRRNSFFMHLQLL